MYHALVTRLPLGPNFPGGNLLNISGSDNLEYVLRVNCDKSLGLTIVSTSSAVILVVPDLISVITSTTYTG